MSLIREFFEKFKSKTKKLDRAKYEIPEEYSLIDEKIKKGEIILEELDEVELKKIEDIFEKKLEKEKNEIAKMLEEYKELKKLNNKG